MRKNIAAMMPPPMAAMLPSWKMFWLWSSGSVRRRFSLMPHGLDLDAEVWTLQDFPQSCWDKINLQCVEAFVHNAHSADGLDSFQDYFDILRHTISGEVPEMENMNAVSMMRQHWYHFAMTGINVAKRRLC